MILSLFGGLKLFVFFKITSVTYILENATALGKGREGLHRWLCIVQIH